MRNLKSLISQVQTVTLLTVLSLQGRRNVQNIIMAWNLFAYKYPISPNLLCMTVHYALLLLLLLLLFVINHADYVKSVSLFVCLFVCLSVCLFVCISVCLQHNSKTNDPKEFKLGIGNDLGMSYMWHSLGVKMSKVKVTGSISPFCILEPWFIAIR